MKKQTERPQSTSSETTPPRRQRLLKLNLETLRTLVDAELKNVAGGGGSQLICPPPTSIPTRTQ